MAASVLTFFLNNPLQSGSSAGLLDVNQPVTTTSITGWNVGSIGTAFSFATMQYNFEVPSGAFTNGGPGEPVGPPNASAHSFAIDCFRTASVYTGVFSAGTWYSCASMLAVTRAQTGAGNLRWRIWRASSLSGSHATEITHFSSNSCLIGSTITALGTSVAQTSSASTQVAQFSVSGEYLFLQCAWQKRSASNNASADCAFRFGAGLTITDGSGLITSAFSDTTPAPTGGAMSGYLLHHYYHGLVEGQL